MSRKRAIQLAQEAISRANLSQGSPLTVVAVAPPVDEAGDVGIIVMERRPLGQPENPILADLTRPWAGHPSAWVGTAYKAYRHYEAGILAVERSQRGELAGKMIKGLIPDEEEPINLLSLALPRPGIIFTEHGESLETVYGQRRRMTSRIKDLIAGLADSSIRDLVWERAVAVQIPNGPDALEDVEIASLLWFDGQIDVADLRTLPGASSATQWGGEILSLVESSGAKLVLVDLNRGGQVVAHVLRSLWQGAAPLHIVEVLSQSRRQEQPFPLATVLRELEHSEDFRALVGRVMSRVLGGGL